MVITKYQLQDIVDSMPEKMELEQIFDRILLSGKIERAKEQIANGEYFTEEEMTKEIDSWFEN